MNEATIAVLATIYGEAAQSSPGAWRAIASVIMNRIGFREWRKYRTPLAVVANTGFDAFAQENAPFCAAKFYLEKDRTNARLRMLQETVLPILDGTAPRTTDAVLYYSPKALAWLHENKPGLYRRPVPSWSLHPDVERVFPDGVLASDDFAFFRYRRVA